MNGFGGEIGLLGDLDTVSANNELINTVANDQGETLTGSGDTVNGSNNLALNVGGGNDTINLGAGDTASLAGGAGYTVNNDNAGSVVGPAANTAASVTGAGGGVYLAGSNDSAITNNETIGVASGNAGDSVQGSGDTIFTANNDMLSLAGGADALDLAGTGDTASLTAGSGYSVYNDGPTDQVSEASGVAAQVMLTGGALDPGEIDAVYNAVLDRDPSAAELASAEAYLAMGATTGQFQAMLANSPEAQADLASTYAAVGAAAPNPADEAAFADAMSTSYGAPIELVSVDPGDGVTPGAGAQTELADTSATNLLVELPVLESVANGVNLGLQLADGMHVQFASTAGLATFLYALAVQQMQATSFVTDNYNLDMQWLSTVDQPLLEEAVNWSEHAAFLQSLGGATYHQQAVEFNTMADLALRIAGEAPGSRTDMQVTITNPLTGNPTQVTVYANASGGSVHDIAPGIGPIVEAAVSTVLNVAAAVFGQPELYAAAAALDAAEAGQAFANGEIVPGSFGECQWRCRAPTPLTLTEGWAAGAVWRSPDRREDAQARMIGVIIPLQPS